MHTQKFIVTTKIPARDGCGNEIRPVSAGEVRRGVLNGVDYADAITAAEITDTGVYVLTQAHITTDKDVMPGVMTAVYASAELAEKALKKWIRDAVEFEYLGCDVSDEDKEKDIALALANWNMKLEGTAYTWSIVERPLLDRVREE